MPFPFDIWTWSRLSDLNVAYWIKKLEEISARAVADLETLEEWKTDTLHDLDTWKTQTLADVDAWESEVLSALELWKEDAQGDISDWESQTLTDLNAWKAVFTAEYETLAARVEAIVSATEEMIENLAPPFSAAASYIMGDYVVQNGALYRFTADHPAGAWTGADAERRTAMQDIGDLSSDTFYNEIFTNTGKVSLRADMLENGIWYRGNKQVNANRGRIKRLIPVKAGMKLSVEVLTTAFDIFWAVAATRPWTTYAQGGSNGTWITAAGTTSISITADGFLVLMIRNHAADTTPVDCSAFAQAVTVETYLEKTYLTDDLAFIPRGIVPNGTDLNTLRNPGSYILQSGYSYENSPFSSVVAGVLLIFRGTANTYSEVIRSIGSPIYSHLYQRSLTRDTIEPTFTDWRRIDGTFELLSTGDTTDRTAEIETALHAFGSMRFGTGEFYLGHITLGADDELSGCGPATIIRSIAGNLNSVFDLNDRCSIHDLTLVGDDQNARTDTPTSRDGIHFLGTYVYQQGGDGYERGMMYNLRIRNFSGSGIKLSHTGPDISDNCLIHNVMIEGCSVGLDIDYSSEYHRITNLTVQRCWWGCINNGGNNIFTGCDFSGNVVGLQMQDHPAGASINNSHGSFEGCSFNHSRSAAGTPNKGTAIFLDGIDLGEIFTGCQVHYGSIIVQGSTGVRFIGLNVGHEVPIQLINNHVITFTDCTFADAPASADSPVTGSGNVTGNGTVIWTGCYLRSGAVFAPAV